MNMTPAPFYNDIAGGPEGGSGWWLKTEDGLRIRIGYWPVAGARGTLLMLPGRTEYIEKYGDTAREMAERGYATLAIDWRGQGLADRMLGDGRVGHIDHFDSYQLDMKAVMAALHQLGAPEPVVLLGHSMGGGIGLRAVMDGLPVHACAFSGPMWDIYMTALVKPFGWALPRMASLTGLGHKLPPSTSYESYVLNNEFDGNMLTRDRDMYDMMRRQLTAQPDLRLGGPSLIWLREAMNECRRLMRRPSPDLPCVTFLGAKEKIIDRNAVRNRMAVWPNGELIEFPDAEHEVLMEVPAVRHLVFDKLAGLFESVRPVTAQSA